DLLRRLVRCDPAGDSLDLRVTAVPEHVLEQDPQRVRKPRDVPFRLERVEPVDGIRAVADSKLVNLGHASIQAEAPAPAPQPRVFRLPAGGTQRRVDSASA